MPRQKGIQVENKLIKGLITENQALTFPTDACTDTDNCVFHQTGVIYRRKGVDLETNHVPTSVTLSTGIAINEFLWTNVANGVDKSFVVQQVGNDLHFYDVSSSVEIGTNYLPAIDTSAYIVTADQAAAATDLRQFAQGRGTLFVVSKYHTVLAITWVDAALSVSTVSVKHRDFEGLEDEYDLTFRPPTQASSLSSFAPKHYYNIINQGWHWRGGSALASFISQSVWPSNTDFIGYFKGGTNNTFQTSLVANRDAGNSPAPKGHFILDVGQVNRSVVLINDNFNAIALDTGVEQISLSGSTTIAHGLLTNTANAFDSNLTTACTYGSIVFNTYLGKQFTSATLLNHVRLTHITNDTGTVYLYGSNSNPAHGTNGVLLGQTPFIDLGGTEVRTITITNTTNPSTAYSRYWIYKEFTNGDAPYFHEISFWRATETSKYPETVAFLNGRVFYAGYDDATWASKILFTQVIERDEQLGHCYQINDPTSDEIADVYPSDGGVINVPEITRILRLWPFRDQLLILATNGVWVLSGTAGAPFSATAYAVSRVSNIGALSAMSSVDVKGLPIWWGEDGIYALEFDPNYNSSKIKNLAEDTIKSFYLSIPEYNRSQVKGCYDRYNDVVLWVYNGDTDLSPDSRFMYNHVLCLNSRTGAFYPWTLTTSTTRPQVVQGILYVEDKSRAASPLVKFPITYSGTVLNFAEVTSTGYLDWESYADDSGYPADVQDYSSYLISGYRVDGQGIKKFQTNHFYIYLKRETDGSGYVQGIYQFSDSGNSGKWSTPQQIYNASVTRGRDDHSIKVARVKLRGSGQSLQIRIVSESGKPFSIIGWGFNESANADI